jgi:hypothetical protein
VLAEIIQFTRQFLASRALAYRRVFALDNRDARMVLADLAKFCRATKSTAHADPHVAARLDGRREVFLRIAEHLNLTTDELYRLYGGPTEKSGPG